MRVSLVSQRPKEFEIHLDVGYNGSSSPLSFTSQDGETVPIPMIVAHVMLFTHRIQLHLIFPWLSGGDSPEEYDVNWYIILL